MPAVPVRKNVIPGYFRLTHSMRWLRIWINAWMVFFLRCWKIWLRLSYPWLQSGSTWNSLSEMFKSIRIHQMRTSLEVILISSLQAIVRLPLLLITVMSVARSWTGTIGSRFWTNRFNVGSICPTRSPLLPREWSVPPILCGLDWFPGMACNAISRYP